MLLSILVRLGVLQPRRIIMSNDQYTLTLEPFLFSTRGRFKLGDRFLRWKKRTPETYPDPVRALLKRLKEGEKVLASQKGSLFTGIFSDEIAGMHCISNYRYYRVEVDLEAYTISIYAFKDDSWE